MTQGGGLVSYMTPYSVEIRSFSWHTGYTET